jgi:Lrp/AsnC family transcriptional regulator, leucine-responsive regulatory protein
MGTRDTNVSLDLIARKLLDCLRENARLSFAELGRRVGLSASATAERVKRMEDAGIIKGYRAELNLPSIGYPILAIIRLTCQGDQCQPFLIFLKGIREVQECHHITGSAAFVLKVMASSIADLEGLTESLQRFGSLTTEVVLSSPISACDPGKGCFPWKSSATPRIAIC